MARSVNRRNILANVAKVVNDVEEGDVVTIDVVPDSELITTGINDGAPRNLCNVQAKTIHYVIRPGTRINNIASSG